MKIILSPAKKMKEGVLPYETLPVYQQEANRIQESLQNKTVEELMQTWHCSKAIAVKNKQRIEEMQQKEMYMPAILRYVGLQFQYLDYPALNASAQQYIKVHVYILSSMYGILRPMDGIPSYRMDYLSNLEIDNCKTLYDYWKENPAQILQNDLVLNLASQEYSKSVTPYLKPENVVDVLFYQRKNGKLVQQSTFVKMARGLLPQYMAKQKVENLEDLKSFSEMGMHFDEKNSTNHKIVYIQEAKIEE